MRAIVKQDIITLINSNFKDNEVIFEDNWKLKAMWKQFGDEWFICDGVWQLVNENPNKLSKEED